jgi:glutaryl-CoA dehydrogenase
MSNSGAIDILDILDLQSLLRQEQILLQNSVRDFVSKELDPIISECYRKEVFPQHLIKHLGALGLLGSHLDGYGLPDLDPISYGLIMRELERCDSGLRSFASVQGALVMYPIHQYGSEDQKAEWLPKLASGELVGCFALTEADGGSDPAAMKTTAVKKDGGWSINGSKMWITNAPFADLAIVWARVEYTFAAFLIPLKETKGVSVRTMEGKMSLRASATGELYFDNVWVEDAMMLPRAMGLKAALSCLTQARYGITWGVLGAAEACFEEAVKYSKQRVLFGKVLASRQLIQSKLATILSDISKGQLVAWRLGQLKTEHRLNYAQVSFGKQNNCQMALTVARTCRDILGANGIMDEYKVMRHMCNLESVYTYEGTNDIHLLILGGQITGESAF